LMQAEQASAAAATACAAAVTTEARLLQEQQTQEARLEALREQFRDTRQRQQEAEREAQRRGRECLRLYHELPELVRQQNALQQVVDWMTTQYPRKEELDLLQRESLCTTPALHRWQEAQAVHDRWQKVCVERDTTQRALAAQEAELPGDVDVLRRRNAVLVGED